MDHATRARYSCAALLLAAGVLMLAGCAEPASPVPGVAGEPTAPGRELSVLGLGEPDDLGPAIRVYERPGGLTVVTLGSSSCPNVPQVVEVDSSRKVIEMSGYTWGGDGACAADLAPRTFELGVAGDLGSYVVEVVPG